MLMNSPYQPLVKWYELSVLGPIALYSILGYQLVMFLKLCLCIVSVRPSAWRNLIGTWLIVALCLLNLNGAIESGIRTNFMIVYAALVTILGTLASLHCYQRLEIEA